MDSAILENTGFTPLAESNRNATAANRSWEIDRTLMLEKSERRGWLVGGAGLLLAMLGVLAALAQGPLR